MLHLQYGNLTIQMNEIDLIELTNRGKKVASCEPINYIQFNIILNYESTIEYDTDRYKKYNFVKYTLGEQCQMISFLENNYKLDHRKMFQMMEEVRIQTQLLFNTNTHKTKKKILSVDLFKKIYWLGFVGLVPVLLQLLREVIFEQVRSRKSLPIIHL